MTDQCMLDDPSGSLFIHAEVSPRPRRTCFGDFDLVEVLLDSCELFENGMFLRFDAVQSKICFLECQFPKHRLSGKLTEK